jgi:hypothetical protein
MAKIHESQEGGVKIRENTSTSDLDGRHCQHHLTSMDLENIPPHGILAECIISQMGTMAPICYEMTGITTIVLK